MVVASFVVGRDVLVGVTVSCDVPSVACGSLSVFKGVHVMGVLGRDG